MHEESIFAIPRWNLPQILLVSAGLFALGAVAFFLAVYLQLRSTGNISGPVPGRAMSLEEKTRIMAQLSTHGSTTTTDTTGTHGARPAHVQADERDPNAAAKLNILKGLDSH